MKKVLTSLAAGAVFFLGVAVHGFAAFIDENNAVIKPVIGRMQTYTVQPGDNFFEVARKFHTTMPHIRRANGMTPREGIKPGAKLIIPRFQILPEVLETGIVLNLPELRLYFFKEGKLVVSYPVTAGRFSMRTPIGNYKIISKVLNPTWSPPAWAGIDHPVPPGPRNPLGDRWIGLNADGVGIHSTNAPASIGKFVSHGCIRMYPWHVSKLFKLVEVGMPVHIIYKPVKAGMVKGRLYIEAHPDFYRRGGATMDEAYALLDTLQIREGVDEKKIQRVYEAARGIPEPVFGEKLDMFLDGNPSELEWPVLLKDGMYYMHLSELAMQTGLDVVWDEEEKRLHVGRNGQNLTYELNTNSIYLGEQLLGQGQYLLQVRGEIFVPLKYTLQALSFPFSFDLKKKTVNITL